MAVSHHSPHSSPSPQRAWPALLLCGLLLSSMLAWQAGDYGRRTALADLQRSAESAAALRAQALRSEIERLRALPFVLAEDADVQAALRAPRDTASLARVDKTLLHLTEGTGAAVMYLIGTEGRAIAASNYGEQESFVGVDYRFRRYYQAALSEGAHEQFAMGSISHRPGLYLARRVGDAASPLGVVVVKLEFDALESEWRSAGTEAFVSDADGVLLIASRPEWRFATTAPLSTERQRELRESLQFGEAPLLPLALKYDVTGWTLPQDAASYARTRIAVPSTPWTLNLFTPLAPAVPRAAAQTRLIGALLGIGATTFAGLWLARRQRAQRQAQQQARVQRELETLVEARTRDLRHEEAQRRQLQDELMLATRLATLGQITASVAHEINQPVAAIRAYADNGGVLLERQRYTEVGDNLSAIASLSERIGAITQQLRGYGRRASGQLGPVVVDMALDGALSMVDHRVRRHRVKLQRPDRDPQLRVHAELMPLEQVLVNLLQNALDATASVAEPHIDITVKRRAGRVTIEVADNGAGLSPQAQQRLFTAFATSKPEGLGLGLAISRDIVAAFAGRLDGCNRAEGGAVFSIDLRES